VTLLVPCLQGNYPFMAFLLANLQGMITPRGLPACQSTGNETPCDLPATSLQGIQPLVALLVIGLQGIKPLEAFLLSQGSHIENCFRCS
jgi:hypothetical protein